MDPDCNSVIRRVKSKEKLGTNITYDSNSNSFLWCLISIKRQTLGVLNRKGRELIYDSLLETFADFLMDFLK